MFSGIGILGRLTKKHEIFWISCHLLPANECFQKNDLHLIALLSARENHKKTQHFHCFHFFGVFLSFWFKSACQQCFVFYDFKGFWIPDPEILEKSMTKNQKRTATLWPRVAFYFPFLHPQHSRLLPNVLKKSRKSRKIPKMMKIQQKFNVSEARANHPPFCRRCPIQQFVRASGAGVCARNNVNAEN